MNNISSSYKRKNKRWKQSELEILRNKYGREKTEKIAEELQRSLSSLATRACRSNIKKIGKKNIKKSPKLFYILGVVFGDGSAYKRKGVNYTGYKIELRVISKKFISSFSKAMKSLGLNIGRSTRKEKNRSLLYIAFADSKALYEWVKETKSDDLESYFLENEEYAIEFIKGFYESDGSCSSWGKYNYKQVDITNKKKELLSLLAKTIEKLGINITGIYKNHKGDIYRLKICKQKEIAKFFDIIKPCIKNPFR